MKLKYLVETDDQYLFANCLTDLGAYYGVTVSGIKYKIKNKLIDVKKIDIRLQDLNYEYTIDKYGAVTVDKSVVDIVMDTLVDKNKVVHKSVDKSVDRRVDKSVQDRPSVRSSCIKYVINERYIDQ